MTLSEFEQQTFTFQNKPERDLETYLLALLNLTEQHRNKASTPELLLELLQSGCTLSPHPKQRQRKTSQTFTDPRPQKIFFPTHLTLKK